MDRRTFVKQVTLASSAIALNGLGCGKTGPDPRPNIIFIMTDDHAAHALGCYGSRINSTLNLDRLASEGMRFDNCFCTNSICAPSRASILTGKYSHENGVIDNKKTFDATQQTFPALLQQSGYQTAMIGKWHLKSDPVGFDYWSILPGQGDYYNPDFIEMGSRKQIMGYVTDITTDLALDWLENRDLSRPFCLMYQHKAPHRNWMPAPRHLTLYDDQTIPEPETLFDDHASKSRAAKEQELSIARDLFPSWDLKLPLRDTVSSNVEKEVQAMWTAAYGRMTKDQKQAWDAAYGPKNRAFLDEKPTGKALIRWKYQRYIKDYLRCVKAIDENVGRLLDALDGAGMADNTIIVYTSDQGFFLGDHGWFDKRFMYEEALRMPLLVRYPGTIAAGSVNADIVLNVDLAPTLLEMAGVPVPPEMQGTSLQPLLAGHTPDSWRQAMYYHYYEYPAWHMVKKHYGIRTHRYKLIHFYDDIDAWELYDLQTDPEERYNVYNHRKYRTIVRDLTSQLSRLQQQL